MKMWYSAEVKVAGGKFCERGRHAKSYDSNFLSDK